MVIFVEDDTEILEMHKDFAKDLGEPCTFVNSTEEAIKVIANGKFGVLVTDLGLPDLNGVELIKKIRETDKNMEIIIASGNPDLLEEAEKSGANLIALKPIDFPDLFQDIQISIKRYKTKSKV